MTSDAVIEAAARKLSGMFGGPVSAWLADARTFADDGLLVDELPVEPLPEGQARIDPDKVVWQKSPTDLMWGTWGDDTRLTDDDVRDWPVLVPETDLDDLRAERDRLKARVAELEATEGCAVDAYELGAVVDKARVEWLKNFDDERRPSVAIADAIREHVAVAVDLRDVPSDRLGKWTSILRNNVSVALDVLSQIADAELARRSAESGEQS